MTEEQSQGISGLMNVAIGDLDRVTQQNAAMAEELLEEFEFLRTEGLRHQRPSLRTAS